jgi:hypothetical protein
MTLKINLLRERLEFIEKEFSGGDLKINDTDDKSSFVELEFEVNSTTLLQLFHAGFNCGYETGKINTAKLF